MKKRLILVILVILILHEGGWFQAAPLPQIGPLNIKGTIKEISWYPEKFMKKIAGASGTLGKDRVKPAHYVVMLRNTTVDDRKSRNHHPAFKSGKDIRVVINHGKNDGFLKPGMVVEIFGYRVTGDEGGTWTHMRNITILKRKTF